MNREQVLAKSKQENRGQDVVSLETAKASMQLGWLVSVCILAAVAVTEAVICQRMNSGIFVAVTAGSAAVFLSKYVKLRRRHELILCIALDRKFEDVFYF